MAGLVAYAVAVLVAWLLALVVRAVLRGGGRAGTEPSPEDVAYLTGGPRQAVYAAVAALRSTGSIQAQGGRLCAAGPLQPGVGELSAAAYHAVTASGFMVDGLPEHPAVRAALHRTRERLHGLLLSRGRRWAMGLVTVPLFALMLFGAIRFLLNLTGDTTDPASPVSLLTLVVAVLALMAGSVVASRAQIRNRAGNRLVRDLRSRHAALAPRPGAPVGRTGPAAAALAVGLFGTAALWAADPAFARASEVEEQRVTARGGYGGDGGFRDSGDSTD